MRYRARARMMLFAAGLMAGPALTAPAARAQTSPPHLRPTQDVAVTYEVRDGRNPARRVPVAWQAAAQRIRAEPEGLPGWMLVDLPQGQARMVLEAQGMTVNLPAGDMTALLGGIPPQTQITRSGEATVAGHRCTVWRVERKDVQGTACLTRDGVLLRAEGTSKGREGSLVATEVTYGRQDPARFTVPAGYTAVTLPPALLAGLLRGG